MVLLDINSQLVDDTVGVCQQFRAEVFLLSHSGTGIRKGFQATLYTASSMQTVTIDDIIDRVCCIIIIIIIIIIPIIIIIVQDSLETGQRGKITFRFLKHSEFIRKGWKIIFHEGRTRGMGEITELIPLNTNIIPNR